MKLDRVLFLLVLLLLVLISGLITPPLDAESQRSERLVIPEVFIVHYTTSERCSVNECQGRTLLFCGDGTDRCNDQYKTVDHMMMFEQLDAALRFVNRENGSSITLSSTFPYIKPTNDNLPPGATFLRIYRAVALDVKQEKIGEDEVEETRVVKVKKDRLKWVTTTQ